MRASMPTLRVGLLLTGAVVVVIVLSRAWGLQLEPYALTGVALGGVLGLVPDRTPVERLAGFVAGFVAVYVGFALRALVLPDATSGRVVGALVTCVVVVAVSFAARGHLPLWAALLGIGAYSGVYEQPFAAAVPQMATTSVDVATSLLAAAAVGFVVAALAAPIRRAGGTEPRLAVPRPHDGEPTAPVAPVPPVAPAPPASEVTR